MPELSSNRWYRVLEIIPGSMVWLTFIMSITLSFVRPVWVVIFIIVLSSLWMVRVSYFVFYLLISWSRFRDNQRVNWTQRLSEHTKTAGSIIHAVVLPTYTEPIEILNETIQSLLQADYPSKQIIIVLAGEERDRQRFESMATALVEQYRASFFDMLVTLHPDGLPGELKAKGANANWAGHKLQDYCNQHSIEYARVIVSYFDCDTCVAANYFSMLTTTFLEHPNRFHTAYQPIALYNNNIWESTMFARLCAFSTTFWLMTEMVRPDRLYTFSSHAMSMVPLVDVGFWQRDVVTDDSRIFLQCFLHYDGNFTVTPIYTAVSMNTASTNSWWRSAKNLYRQVRRWAWSAEHFPYMVWHFYHNKKIPWNKKRKYLWNLTEGVYTWATTPILLFALGRLPLWVMARQQYPTTLLTYNAPTILGWLMLASTAGILVSALLGVRLLPHRPKHTSPIQFLQMILQWLLLPFSLIVFGSVPAIDAQTRLMLGRYLGFHVTEKVATKKS